MRASWKFTLNGEQIATIDTAAGPSLRNIDERSAAPEQLPVAQSATSSSQWDGSFSANNVIESTGNPWHSGAGATPGRNQWLAFDFGAPKRLTAIALSQPQGWAGAEVQNFAIKASGTTDGPWETVAEFTALRQKDEQMFTFPAATARCWQIFLKDEYGYGYITVQHARFTEVPLPAGGITSSTVVPGYADLGGRALLCMSGQLQRLEQLEKRLTCLIADSESGGEARQTSTVRETEMVRDHEAKLDARLDAITLLLEKQQKFIGGSEEQAASSQFDQSLSSAELWTKAINETRSRLGGDVEERLKAIAEAFATGDVSHAHDLHATLKKWYQACIDKAERTDKKDKAARLRSQLEICLQRFDAHERAGNGELQESPRIDNA